MNRGLAQARSLLFVPATRLERISKAFDAGADAVIVDLEDAVPVDSKDTARAAFKEFLPQLSVHQRARLLVRINAVATPWFDADLALIVPAVAQGLGAVMLPKSELPLALRALVERLGPSGRVVPLIESLAGLDQADLLARESRVLRLDHRHRQQ